MQRSQYQKLVMSGFNSRSGHADHIVIIAAVWNVKVDDFIIVIKASRLCPWLKTPHGKEFG